MVPLALFVFGMVVERLFMQWLPPLDPLYNFLLTFGLTLVLRRPGQARVRRVRASLRPTDRARRRFDLGLFALPGYQVFVLGSRSGLRGVWLVMTRTRVG